MSLSVEKMINCTVLTLDVAGASLVVVLDAGRLADLREQRRVLLAVLHQDDVAILACVALGRTHE